MFVPEIEQTVRAAFPLFHSRDGRFAFGERVGGRDIGLAESDPYRARNCCHFCGARLKVHRRIARLNFCSAAHAESSRQQRALRIARRLDEASQIIPPRRAPFILPEPRLACVAPTALRVDFLASHQDTWMQPKVTAVDLPSRLMAASLGPERFMVPSELNTRPRHGKMCWMQAGQSAARNRGQNGSLRRDLLPEIVSERDSNAAPAAITAYTVLVSDYTVLPAGSPIQKMALVA